MTFFNFKHSLLIHLHTNKHFSYKNLNVHIYKEHVCIIKRMTVVVFALTQMQITWLNAVQKYYCLKAFPFITIFKKLKYNYIWIWHICCNLTKLWYLISLNIPNLLFFIFLFYIHIWNFNWFIMNALYNHMSL